MDILKYFYEEPAATGAAARGLDPLDELLAGPHPARGYLAGTRLSDEPGERPRVGLTSLADPALYVRPLLDLFSAAAWTRWTAAGAAGAVEPEAALSDLNEAVAFVLTGSPLGGARAVLLPEPAHDGHDLAILAAEPLRDLFVAALRRHPAPGARRFVVPYRRARGEHHFYFEQWQLDALPPHIEEV